MIHNAKYVHTNLIAHDWRSLSSFYRDVFGCLPVPPERRFSGRELESGTGVPDASLEGAHLRFPGCGEDGPTLEILQYSRFAPCGRPAANRPGFAHIAFLVDSVAEARDEVLRRGGGTIGEIVTLAIATGARITWCYVTDPEGNIVELQSWRSE
jgi:predicted enzyme related to lactoylglutathione lyase